MTSNLISPENIFTALSLRFEKDTTRDLDWRERSLARLEEYLRSKELDVLHSLSADLGKPEFEAFANEYGFVMEELRIFRREFRSWASKRRVGTPLKLQPAKSEIWIEPKGVVLILAPWNYPFQLSVAPLIASIAAGNVCALKPSEFTPRTTELLTQMAKAVWPDGEVVVVDGDGDFASKLVDQRWDHVFFTGSTEVGRKVAETCARHLTPVTLELGGKSPCVVGPFKDGSSNDIEVATRRIAWGKFVNAGQTCIAPDYLLVHESNEKEVIAGLTLRIEEFYGKDPIESNSYTQIISHRHLERLNQLLSDSEVEVLLGGNFDKARRLFAPTIVKTNSLESKIMKEEIFGPILPILTWKTEADIDRIVSRNPRPLAFYVFSDNRIIAEKLMHKYAFGGGCFNDTLVHIANAELPFGGVGESGMGSYHGRWGFDTFSRMKPVLKRGFWFDVKLRYPPYGEAWKRVKGLLQ